MVREASQDMMLRKSRHQGVPKLGVVTKRDPDRKDGAFVSLKNGVKGRGVKNSSKTGQRGGKMSRGVNRFFGEP